MKSDKVVKTCNYCKKPGHPIKDCYKKKNGDSKANSQPNPKKLECDTSVFRERRTVSEPRRNDTLVKFKSSCRNWLKFLIDTHAHISVILTKPKMMQSGTPIYHDNHLNINGVGKGIKLRTLGYSLLHLEPFIMETGHKFHLLKDENHDLQAKPIQLVINDFVKLVKEPYDKHKEIYSGLFLVQDIDGPNVTILDCRYPSITVHNFVIIAS